MNSPRTRTLPLAVSVALFVSFLVVLVVTCRVAHAQAHNSPTTGLKIRVRGAGKIVTRASRDNGELLLSGALSDDSGQPLPAESITIEVTRDAEPRDPRTAEGIRAARGCDRATDRALAYGVRSAGPPDAPQVVVVTDEAGRFCFRVRLPQDRYQARLHWKGAGLVDAAAAELAFDLARAPLTLEFDPVPRIVSLDSPRTTVEVTALVDDNGATTVAPRLVLALTNEKNLELERATTDASGRAHFTVPSSKLGLPGPGELRVSFAGDAETAYATRVADIERHVKVNVRVPAAERGELKPLSPEDGIPLAVDVVASTGPVMEGAIEARIGDALVGSAPVERGTAKLTLTFTAEGPEAQVFLRYVPLAPWFEPLGESAVRVPIRGPSLFSKVPILVAGLAVLAFFLIGRLSPSQKVDPIPDVVEPPPPGKAEVALVRAATADEPGWRGVVVDAHDGTPVAGARVWVERGTFEGSRILAETHADGRGHFVLSPLAAPAVGDERIFTDARLHTRHEQSLPAYGTLSIALVLRKRALLSRLVAWARRRGAPFDARPEPTPGHVKRAAGDDFETARWADAVERAAFGEGEIDAGIEREIDGMGPKADPAPNDLPDDRR